MPPAENAPVALGKLLKTLAIPAVLLLLSLSAPALAKAPPPFTGKVIGVADGDTVTVLRDKKQVKVRFYGIDCPEKKQPFGKKAKQFTSKLVFGKLVEVEPVVKDRYGRLVGHIHPMKLVHRVVKMPSGDKLERTVWVRDGLSVNKRLVKAGLAWWYRRYAPKDKELAQLVSKAIKAKRGLWADVQPIAPWNWRRKKRAYDPLAFRLQRDGFTKGDSLFKGKAAATGPLRCNVKSNVCHRPGCRHYRCKSCAVRFGDMKAAKRVGYRGCGRCRR